MKKIIFFIFTILFIVTISSCDDNTASTSNGSSIITTKESTSSTGSNSSNIQNDNVNNSSQKSTNEQVDTTKTVDNSIKSISLSNISMSLRVGSSSTVFVNYNPVNADNRFVNWFSSNPSVASVSANGTISANSKGNVTITARTNNGKEATCLVSVTGESISLSSFNFNNYFDVEQEMLPVDSSYNLPIVSYITLKDGYEIPNDIKIRFSINVYYTFYRILTGRPSRKESGTTSGTIDITIKQGKKVEINTSYIKIGAINGLNVTSFKNYSTSVTGWIEKVKVV